MENINVASGGRKTSKAVARLSPGSGKITVNRKPIDEYFPDPYIQDELKKPLVISESLDRYDVNALVKGGGKTAQAEAIRLAISRVLVKENEDMRPLLRGEHLLTRDPRMKERKKYGRKAARRGFQWTKR